MIDTYLRDHTDGIRQYDILGEADVIGFAVSLCEIESRQFLLFRAKSWNGRQPRFALIPTDDEFLPALRNLSRIGVKKIRGEVKLEAEAPIHLGPGTAGIPPHHEDKLALWNELTA